MSLYNRCLSVIDSCKTKEHFNCARRYITLCERAERDTLVTPSMRLSYSMDIINKYDTLVVYLIEKKLRLENFRE